MARTKSGIFRCKGSFAYSVGGGVTRVCKIGDLVDSDHAAYRYNKAAFVPVDDFVEQATAAPGEKRNVAPKPAKPESKAKSKSDA